MRVFASRRLPWLIAGLAVALVSLGATLSLLYIARTGDVRPLVSHQGLIPLATLTYAGLGGLVAARQPKNVIGWLLLATALLLSLNALSIGNSVYETLDSTRQMPWADLFDWLRRWVWIPGAVLPLIFVLLYFPDGRLLSPRWRVLSWGTGLALAGSVVSVALHPGTIESWDIAGPNPYGIPGASSLLEGLLNLGGALLLAAILGALLAVGLRLRRSRGIERAQLKWVAYAAIVLALAFGLVWAAAAAWLSEDLANEIGTAVTNLLILGIAVSVSIAILRYRLYDIDLVINRTLVYSGLTVTVAVIYTLVVGLLGLLLQARGSLIASLFGVGLVAIVAQPVRDRFQRGVNRLMYGERDDPYAVLSRLGQRLGATFAPQAVLPTIVETVAQALKLPYAAITLKHAEAFTTVAEHGRSTGQLVRLPLTYQGEAVGQLVVSPRAPGEAFSPADRRLLGDLARQAGVAVHTVGLTMALQRSREQLVTAREEERRRLRRDLHDGLGAQLAGLMLKLETLRNRLPHEPEAQALLGDLAGRTQAAVADIRRLVYGLRPPALDALGLVEALREAAAQYAPPGLGALGIRIEAPERLPPLPAAVEVAAYRIVQEALTNVLQHAEARQCIVRLAFEPVAGNLALEIRDDGRGLPARRRSGVGLGSMRERAEELGGQLLVEPVIPTGTRVLARLPCPAPAAATAAALPPVEQ
ncbi:MAG: sensor histidine kinase [Anaerolineales bacterium]|nr:sensor histidine kinase [Anaerolineales bacterium]